MHLYEFWTDDFLVRVLIGMVAGYYMGLMLGPWPSYNKSFKNGIAIDFVPFAAWFRPLFNRIDEWRERRGLVGRMNSAIAWLDYPAYRKASKAYDEYMASRGKDIDNIPVQWKWKKAVDKYCRKKS